MKAGQNQKRSTTLHLALALSIALLGSVLFEVVRPTTASAATFSELSIEDKAKVWIMGRAVSKCVNQIGFWHDNFSESDGANGEWLADDSGWGNQDGNKDLGEWTADLAEGKSDDSEVTCKKVAKKTLELMGVSVKDALCEMNKLADKTLWKRESGDCLSGAGDFDLDEDDVNEKDTDIWNRYFRQWLGGDVEASLTRGMRYLIYSENFYQECSEDHGGGWNTPREWKSGDKESDKVYKLKGLLQLNATADKDWYVVSGGNGRDHEVHIDGYGMLTSDDKLQCETLAERINDNASGYLEEVAKSTNPDDAQDNGSGITDTEEETTCAIDGIGWIICPVMSFIGRMNDAAFNFLEGILGIRPAIITSESTQNAWAAFRDIANVMFVIAFMVIVYSQITSAGLSNYGIKKMLPRIVVAAILVNASYVICALAVDVSNIVGSSVYSLLKDSIAADVGGEITTTAWENSINDILKVAATAIGVILLVVALFMAPMVLVAFALIILILVARQALVILLIVVAPLAFVAYLLPNTEDWFKKWQKAFTVTLMVYPIVGLVFGASTLASQVLMSVAQAGDEDEQLLQLVALGVLAVPLFAVPAILKGSLSAAGSIGAKLSGFADKAQGVGAKQFKANVDDGKNRWNMAAANGKLGIAGGLTRRRMRRDFLRSSRDSEAKRAEGVYTASIMEGDSASAVKYQQAAAGGRAAAPGASVRQAAFATQQEHKRFDEDVAAHKTTMSGMSNSELVAKLKAGEGGAEYQAAVAGTIMSRSHRDSHLEALEAVRQRSEQAEANGDDHAQEVLSGVQKQMAHDMKDKPWALGDQAAGQLVEGTYGRSKSNAGEDQTHFTSTIDQQLNDRVGKKLSAQSLATMNPDEMRRIHDSATRGELTPDQLNVLHAKINEVRSNPQMNALVKPEAQKQFDTILTLSTNGTVRAPNTPATHQEALDINHGRTP